MKSHILCSVGVLLTLSMTEIAYAAQTGVTPGSAPNAAASMVITTSGSGAVATAQNVGGGVNITFVLPAGASLPSQVVCPSSAIPKPSVTGQAPSQANAFNYDLTPLQNPAYFVCSVIVVNAPQIAGQTEAAAMQASIIKKYSLNTSTTVAGAASCSAFGSAYSTYKCILGDLSQNPPANVPNASFCIDITNFENTYGAANTNPTACFKPGTSNQKVAYAYSTFAQLGYGGSPTSAPPAANALSAGFMSGYVQQGRPFDPIFCPNTAKIYLPGPTTYTMMGGPQEIYRCSKNNSCNVALPCYPEQGGSLMWFGGSAATCAKSDGITTRRTITLYPNKKNVVYMGPANANTFLNTSGQLIPSQPVCSISDTVFNNLSPYP